MKTNTLIFSFVAATLLMSGCGGSSSSDGGGTDSSQTGTGYYIDSAVSGVAYVCGTISGITGNDGGFTFEKGKGCTFKLGDITLRSVNAENLADKVKIVEDRVEVAQLLQSLDADGNPDNGITIKPEVIKAMKDNGITKLPENADQVAEVFEAIKGTEGFNGKFVTKEKAQEHLKKSQTEVTKELLAGKTFYAYFLDPDNENTPTVKEIKFNNDATSFTDEAGNVVNAQVNANIITFTYPDGFSDVMTVTYSNDKKYISLYENENDWVKFYFNKADAEAALGGDDKQQGKDDLKTLLAGKTLYEVDSLSNPTSINESKFDKDMTTITLKEVVGDNIGKSETVDITYGNGIIHFSNGGTTQLKTKTADYIELADSDGETTRLYFSLDKAKGYMNSLKDNTQTKFQKEYIGKTLYKADIYDGNPSITAFSFSKTVISANVEFPENIPGPAFEYSSTDNSFSFMHEGVKRTYKITAKSDDHIDMNYYENNELKESFKFFYNSDSAKAYIDSLLKDKNDV